MFPGLHNCRNCICWLPDRFPWPEQ
jgi:hypothetical protein